MLTGANWAFDSCSTKGESGCSAGLPVAASEAEYVTGSADWLPP